MHNRLAGALASSHAAQIAIIIPTLQSIVFTEVLAGIADALEGSGYQPIIGITEYDIDKETQLVQSMMGWRPAGIVLANTRHTAETEHILRNAGVPVVEVMELKKNPIDMCVGIDQWAVGKAMAKHLLAKGYKRFAYLGSNPQLDRAAARRLAGFKSVLGDAGATLVTRLQINEVSGITMGRTHTPLLLEQADNIDAVYFSNDAVAAGAMLYCMSVGIKIPDDLALASFSGLDIAAAMPKPITTIQSPRHTMGRLAGERIRARLNGETPKLITDAGFSLVDGESA